MVAGGALVTGAALVGSLVVGSLVAGSLVPGGALVAGGVVGGTVGAVQESCRHCQSAFPPPQPCLPSSSVMVTVVMLFPSITSGSTVVSVIVKVLFPSDECH